MSESRFDNTKRNIASGLVYRCISILFPFLIRTAIIYSLGADYVGLQSLFSAILQVLSLAELGFSTAVIFHMYKPLAEGDTDTVCALMAYYRKIYSIIGFVILAVGLMLLPFLPHLVKGSWPADINLYLLYLLYLANTVVSYLLFAYKSALLNAVQHIDLVNYINSIVHTGKYILQILVLIVTKSFYAFVVVAIAATAASNLVTAYIADKKYPQYQCRGSVSPEKRREIKTQVGGLMIGKFSDTARNASDSIVLSAMFGLTTVAIYNNYYYIYNAVYGIMLVITHAMQASVGNSVAVESKEKNLQDLKKFQFIFSWIVIWCSVCLFCLYQPFMEIWVGPELLLSSGNMALFCIYFYTINMNNMRNLYFEACGIWWQAKLSFVLEAGFNLILNVILGVYFGISGILMATISSLFVFNFLSRTNLLFKLYFKEKPVKFYISHAYYAVLALALCALTYFVCDMLPFTGIVGLLLRGVICVFLPNCLMLALFWKQPLFQEAKAFALRLVLRRR